MALSVVALLAALTFLFDAAAPQRGAMVLSTGASGQDQVVLRRDRAGHFTAQGSINGVAVGFLVDTGATDVAVPQDLARSLGLEFGPEVTVMTAAGPVPAWMTRIEEVRIGGLALENVRGTITRGPFREVLLGMSFLRHFRMTQQGDELIIESGA